MERKDLLKLLEEFEKETWGYEETDELFNDMQLIYQLEKIIKKDVQTDINDLYQKIKLIIGIIRYKYGYESNVISNISGLNDLNEYIKSIKLSLDSDSNYLNNALDTINKQYYTFLNGLENLDFLSNNFANIQGHEGLALALDSLKSLITNKNYRKLISETDINNILIDYLRLSKKTNLLENLEKKYEGLIKKIWETSLLFDGKDGQFKLLFSNITGGDLIEHANDLLYRPEQNSCSLITSNFIATYGSTTRRIGFIYPDNSHLIAAGAYDLGSNVFGSGITNKEKATKLVTPAALEKTGIERAKEKNEDVLFSSCYNEILIDSMPCGICTIGFGEGDLNVDYNSVIELSKKTNLPIYNINVLDYKKELSNNDKEYLAYHAILSYLNINRSDILPMNEENQKYLYQLIDNNKETISNAFMKLRMNGIVNKENMLEELRPLLGNITLDISASNKTR